MNANKTKKRTLLLLLTLSIAISSYAQDRLFTYTYQSSVLNKGQRELESWNSFRTGKEDYYARLDNRTEYEIGLGKNLQTAFYLNLTSITSTIIDNSNKSLSTENEIGFSNEWKLKLLDPVANPLGAAIYGEVGIFSNEIELEGKVILDKKIGNFTIAANGVYEQEFAPGFVNNELKWQKEKKIEGYLAFAYSLSPKFSLTLENAYKNLFLERELTNSAVFSGLGFSYVQDKFWVNFTVMPQISSFKGAKTNNLDLNEYEKIQLRLLFSFTL
jgi:hypothetical protein